MLSLSPCDSLSLSLSTCLSISGLSPLTSQSNYSAFPLEDYLTPEVWKEIREGSVYQRDYEIFSKIKSRPFNFSLYDSPPIRTDSPSNRVS
jgi:hypothetical protein